MILKNYISEGSVSHINGVWPNSKHLQLVGSSVMHTGKGLRMRRNCLINCMVTLQPFFKLMKFVVFLLSSMEATVSEIMSQLKLMTDGIALICQDVDRLKRASLFQPNNSEEPVDTRAADETADDSVPPPNQLLTSNNSSLVTQNTGPASSQSSMWAEEMDNRDPLLDDNDPEAGTKPINVIPVTERTNTFLTEAFTCKMTGAERRELRSHYTLPQNELIRAPFLDTMMASECSSKVKSTDRSLFTLQGLTLEVIGPLNQLLEAENDPELNVSMDQIGDAVETAITLLANVANKTSLMRRSRILEEYNRELVPFAAAQERDWTSAAP